MRDPEPRLARLDAEPEPWLGVVVFEILHVDPAAAVVADDRRRVLGDGAAVRLIVVFARESHNVERQSGARGAVNAEIIPARLAVASILIALAVHEQPEVLGIDFLYALETAAFELPADFGSTTGAGEEKSDEDRGFQGSNCTTDLIRAHFRTATVRERF